MPVFFPVKVGGGQHVSELLLEVSVVQGRPVWVERRSRLGLAVIVIRVSRVVIGVVVE